MQKWATRIFIGSSVCFGVFGVIFTLTDFGDPAARLLFATGFVVLSSFALSVAGKYLLTDD